MKKIKENVEKLNNESKGFIKEFKTFIARGNVMDLAVGVIIGSAFSKIVTSFTTILTSLIGLVLGGINFAGLSFTVKDATINYGEFIQAIFDFLITAFCIFLLIKVINKIMRKEKKEEPKTPPKKADDVILLEEIRDLLKENNTKKK
ncbi:MAG: large conductance mechanosensitive channel protein MscL [Firmicutes bacterium]|nr:large conductance mechanosensitive channel protein MscL [Bacillota bacterium]